MHIRDKSGRVEAVWCSCVWAQICLKNGGAICFALIYECSDAAVLHWVCHWPHIDTLVERVTYSESGHATLHLINEFLLDIFLDCMQPTTDVQRQINKYSILILG